MAARTSTSCSTSRHFREGRKSLAHIMATGTSGLNNKRATGPSALRTGFARVSPLACGSALVLSLGAAPAAWAARTEFTPIISISDTYTNHVELAPPGPAATARVQEPAAGV